MWSQCEAALWHSGYFPVSTSLLIHSPRHWAGELHCCTAVHIVMMAACRPSAEQMPGCWTPADLDTELSDIRGTHLVSVCGGVVVPALLRSEFQNKIILHLCHYSGAVQQCTAVEKISSPSVCVPGQCSSAPCAASSEA